MFIYRILLLAIIAPILSYADLSTSVSLDSGAPTAIYPTQETNLKVIIANSSTNEVTDVAFNIDLPGTMPEGLKINSSVNYSCKDDNGVVSTLGTLNASVNSTNISLSGGRIPSKIGTTDGSCSIIIPVTTESDNTASYQFTIADAAVTGKELGSNISNSGAVSQTINILTLSPYVVQETYSSSNVYQLDEPTLTITVTNPNPVDINNFSITDTFDANGYIEVASTPSATASCDNGGATPTFNPSTADTTLTLSGTLPASGSCTFTTKVKANGSDTSYSVNTNNTLSDGSNDLDITPTLNEAILNITGAIKITESLKDGVTYNNTSPISIKAGDWQELTLTIENQSSTTDLTNLALSLPNHIRKGDSYGADAADPNARGMEYRNIQTTCGGTASIDSNTTLSLTGATLVKNSTCTVTSEYRLFTDDAQSYTYYLYGVIPHNVVTSSENVYSYPVSSDTYHYLIVTTPLVTSQKWKDLGDTQISNLVAENSGVLEIKLENQSATDINVSTFTDTIDGVNSSEIDITSSSTTCTGGSVVASGKTFTLTGGTVLANDSCLVTLNFDTSLPSNTGSSTFNNEIAKGAVATTDTFHVSGGSFSGDLKIDSPLQTTIGYVLKSDPTTSITALTSGVEGRINLNIQNLSTDTISDIQLSLDPVLNFDENTTATDLNITDFVISGCPSAVIVDQNTTGISFDSSILSGNSDCNITADFIVAPRIGDNSTEYYLDIKSSGALGENGVLTGTLNSNTIVAKGVNTNDTKLTITGPIQLSKSQQPGVGLRVVPGNPIKYSIDVDNYNSSSALTNVSVTDNLPNGVTFLNGVINGHDFSPTLTGTNCGVPTTANVTDDTTVSFTIPNIDAAPTGDYSRCTLSFYGMLPPTETTNGTINAYNNILNAGDVCTGAICNGGQTEADSALVSTAPLGTRIFYENYSFSSGTYSTAPYGSSYYYGYTGAPTRVKLAIENYTLNEFSDVHLTATLPIVNGKQMKVAYPVNFSTTCGTAQNLPEQNDTTINITNLTLPARADNGISNIYPSCYVQFDVTGEAETYDTDLTITNLDGIDANGNARTFNDVNTTNSYRYISALSASLTFTPDSIITNRQSTVSVQLYNSSNGPTVMNDVTISKTLPSGIKLAPSPNTRTTCDGSISITAFGGGDTISMSGASLERGQSCYLYYDVEVDFPGAVGTYLTDNIDLGELTAEGGDIIASASSSDLITRAAAPSDNILLSLSTDPSSLTFPGQVSQLTMTLTAGTSGLTGLKLPVYFTDSGDINGTSNSVVLAPNPQAISTCTNAEITANSESGMFEISNVSMSASETCSVKVNVLSTDVGGKTITIPIGSTTTDQGVTNANLASTSIAIASNIGLLQSFTPNVVNINERSKLKFTFYNPTALPMTNLSVTNNLPSGLVVADGAIPQTTCSGAIVSMPTQNQITISNASIAGTIEGGTVESCYALIDVISSSAGEYTNTIPIGGVSAIVDGSNATNAVEATDRLIVAAPLSVNLGFLDSGVNYKTNDSDTLVTLPTNWTTGIVSRKPSVNTTLKINITNSNDANVTNLAFNLNLPEGLLVESVPNVSNSCNGNIDTQANGTYINLTAGTLNTTSDCEITVDVKSNTTGAKLTTNLAAASITTLEGITNGEASSATLEILQKPTLAMQVVPSVISPNEISRFTIALNNENSSDITISNYNDFIYNLPDGIRIASNANLSTTCTDNLNIVADNNATSITYNDNSIIPAGGCTISVDITGDTAGDYLHYIAPEKLRTSAGNNLLAASAIFKISDLGYISGRVFKDNDTTPNGTFEINTDTPIVSQTISLYSGGDCSTTLLSTTTTNEFGNYTFSELNAGTYSVCQITQATGTFNSVTTAGSIVSVNSSTGTIGIASNDTTTSSQITSITLNSDGGSGEISGSINNNFSEIVASTISGKVFIDLNNNGLQNGEDLGISGQILRLTGQDIDTNDVNTTVSTSGDGSYTFTNLKAGNYVVTQDSQPADTSNGKTILGIVSNGGATGVATATDILPSSIGTIVLPPNANAIDFNFAELSNNRKISGQVFIDKNDDGLLNESDLGLSGEQIVLFGIDVSGNDVNRTTTSSSSGIYSFNDIPEGTSYSVSQVGQAADTSSGKTIVGTTGGTATDKSDENSTISGINLSGINVISANNNFAEIPFQAPDLQIDIINDPLQFDVGEDAGQYLIRAINSGDVDSNGDINVTISTPDGMIATNVTGVNWNCTINGQDTTCINSSVIPASSQSSPINMVVDVNKTKHAQVLTTSAIVSGGNEPDNLSNNNTTNLPVTILGTGTIGGKLWLDNNRDKLFDAGDQLVQNYIVKIYKDGILKSTVTTNSSGQYTAEKLVPGDYKLEFYTPLGEYIYGHPFVTDGTIINGILNVTLEAGDKFLNENFSIPIDPTGVVYDSRTRSPLSGVELTISGPVGFDASTHIVGGSATYTTQANGHYNFLITKDAPSGDYNITISSYPQDYLESESLVRPACTNKLTIVSTALALIQSDANPPAIGTTEHDAGACATDNALFPNNNTAYYSSFDINATLEVDILNNHIPLDFNLDTDGDGIGDIIEGDDTLDTDADGIPDYKDLDSDGDGIPDSIEGITDSDSDGIANYIDTDSDDDGVSDTIEGIIDSDSDGIANYIDTDSDDDGIADIFEYENNLDTDGDGVPNYIDTDSDDDGILDIDEELDLDEDSIPGYKDPFEVHPNFAAVLNAINQITPTSFLGENASTDEITKPLSLVHPVGVDTTWSAGASYEIDTDNIKIEDNNTTVIVRDNSEDKIVKLNAVVTKGVSPDDYTMKKSFVLTILKDSADDNQTAVDRAWKAFDWFKIKKDNEYQFAVRSDLELKTDGSDDVNITWASSNSSVVLANGTVTRPSEDTFVDLTATFTKGDVTRTKTGRVLVLKSLNNCSDILLKAKDQLQITDILGSQNRSASSVINNLLLGNATTFNLEDKDNLTINYSSDSSYLDIDQNNQVGEISRHNSEDKNVTLTVELTHNGTGCLGDNNPVYKTFDVVIKANNKDVSKVIIDDTVDTISVDNTMLMNFNISLGNDYDYSDATATNTFIAESTTVGIVSSGEARESSLPKQLITTSNTNIENILTKMYTNGIVENIINIDNSANSVEDKVKQNIMRSEVTGSTVQRYLTGKVELINTLDTVNDIKGAITSQPDGTLVSYITGDNEIGQTTTISKMLGTNVTLTDDKKLKVTSPVRSVDNLDYNIDIETNLSKVSTNTFKVVDNRDGSIRKTIITSNDEESTTTIGSEGDLKVVSKVIGQNQVVVYTDVNGKTGYSIVESSNIDNSIATQFVSTNDVDVVIDIQDNNGTAKVIITAPLVDNINF